MATDKKNVKDAFKSIEYDKVKFTGNDIDGAYLLGVFNVSGIDGLSAELNRIKELGLKPHEFLHLLKTKG